MRIWPQTNEIWFYLFRHALKAGIIFSFPALVAYHQAVALPGLFASAVHQEMKVLAQPIETFCIVAAMLLLVTGGIEVYRLQPRNAAWDFVFVILAFFCLEYAASFTVRVK